MDSKAFQMLHFNIELTVVIPSNTERRQKCCFIVCPVSQTVMQHSTNNEIRIQMQNGCQKKHNQNYNQSVIIKKNQQNSNWPPKKS